MSSQSPNSLCQLCQEFTTDLLGADFDLENIPLKGRWAADRKKGWQLASWGVSFLHHGSLTALKKSGIKCSLCMVMVDSFAAADPTTTSGLFLLYPQPPGDDIRPGSFAAIFSDDESYNKTVQSPYEYQFAYKTPWKRFHGHFGDKRSRRATPETWNGDQVWETARSWMRDCTTNHPECQRIKTHDLTKNSDWMPTRLVDIGQAAGDDARLVVTSELGKTAPYVALTYSWGGDVPTKLLRSSVGTMKKGVAFNSLPRTFQDTIFITRALGLRYIWIDALCIIQDSPDDWRFEAARMGSVYACSRLVLSATDSRSSTDGMLATERQLQISITKDIAIQKIPKHFDTLMETSPLASRGWCLQERFLGTRILHVGEKQLYWECRAGRAQENDRNWTVDTPYPSGAMPIVNFAVTRREFFTPMDEDIWGNKGSWSRWYDIVTDYSSRKLSYSQDTFPAIAGLAQAFRGLHDSSQITYISGLWKEDLTIGLLWGAMKIPEPLRKVSGFNKCQELSRPAELRAPSWSWASVVGRVGFNFNFRNNEQLKTCEIVQIDVPESKRNNLMATDLQDAVLVVRGPLCPMNYIPSDDLSRRNAGMLRSKKGSAWLTDCIMDFDRGKARDCYAFLVRWTDGDVTSPCGLALEHVAGNRYKRLGVFEAYYSGLPQGWSEFTTEEIALM